MRTLAVAFAALRRLSPTVHHAAALSRRRDFPRGPQPPAQPIAERDRDIL
jgi:hypothetical protein